jgi:hypothetical protein
MNPALLGDGKFFNSDQWRKLPVELIAKIAHHVDTPQSVLALTQTSRQIRYALLGNPADGISGDKATQGRLKPLQQSAERVRSVWETWDITANLREPLGPRPNFVQSLLLAYPWMVVTNVDSLPDTQLGVITDFIKRISDENQRAEVINAFRKESLTGVRPVRHEELVDAIASIRDPGNRLLAVAGVVSSTDALAPTLQAKLIDQLRDGNPARRAPLIAALLPRVAEELRPQSLALAFGLDSEARAIALSGCGPIIGELQAKPPELPALEQNDPGVGIVSRILAAAQDGIDSIVGRLLADPEQDEPNSKLAEIVTGLAPALRDLSGEPKEALVSIVGTCLQHAQGEALTQALEAVSPFADALPELANQIVPRILELADALAWQDCAQALQAIGPILQRRDSEGASNRNNIVSMVEMMPDGASAKALYAVRNHLEGMEQGLRDRIVTKMTEIARRVAETQTDTQAAARLIPIKNLEPDLRGRLLAQVLQGRDLGLLGALIKHAETLEPSQLTAVVDAILRLNKDEFQLFCTLFGHAVFDLPSEHYDRIAARADGRSAGGSLLRNAVTSRRDREKRILTMTALIGRPPDRGPLWP